MSKKLFDEEINIISEAMQKRLIEKQEKHGDEWKTSNLNYLRHRIMILFDLFVSSIETDKEKIKLVDLANQSMLLYLRLLKKEK